MAYDHVEGRLRVAETVNDTLPVPPPFVLLSGIDRRKGLVQLTRMIENTSAQLILGPGNHRHVGLGQVAQSGERFVSVARRIEEIDGISACDTMRCGVTSILTLFFAITSAAFSTSFHSSRKKAQ